MVKCFFFFLRCSGYSYTIIVKYSKLANSETYQRGSNMIDTLTKMTVFIGSNIKWSKETRNVQVGDTTVIPNTWFNFSKLRQSLSQLVWL